MRYGYHVEPDEGVSFSLDQKGANGYELGGLFSSSGDFYGKWRESRSDWVGCAIHGRALLKQNKGRSTYWCMGCNRERKARRRRQNGRPTAVELGRNPDGTHRPGRTTNTERREHASSR